MGKTYFFKSNNFQKNIFSQYGEDGIIEKISKDLTIEIKTAMEFGAWDGKHYSNTFARVEELKTLLLVEGDPDKYEDLVKTSKLHKSISPHLAYVQPLGEDSVDSICERKSLPSLDLLSIDIDSYDLEIIRHLSMRPKIIVVEFNPTFGALSEYENEENKFRGNSFLSFYNLMSSKNYSLVTKTNTNLFFIDDEVLKENNYFPLRIEHIDILQEIDQYQFKVSCGYDGSKITFGSDKHPWDGSRIAKVYNFPKWLEGWEPKYFQVALRTLRTLSIKELYKGIKLAYKKGWFRKKV